MLYTSLVTALPRGQVELDFLSLECIPECKDECGILTSPAAALGGMCGKPRSALVSRDIRRDMEMKPMVDMTQTLARNWWAVGLRGSVRPALWCNFSLIPGSDH